MHWLIYAEGRSCSKKQSFENVLFTMQCARSGDLVKKNSESAMLFPLGCHGYLF
jgi:hypothetical protein